MATPTGTDAELRQVAEGRLGGYARHVADPEGSQRSRIADSVETTLKLGNGIVLVSIIGGEERLYSEHFACVYCGISLEEIEPRSFSFNNPKGACPECTGWAPSWRSMKTWWSPIPISALNEGAIAPWSRITGASQWYATLLEAVARQYRFSLDTPWKDLGEQARDSRTARRTR